MVTIRDLKNWMICLLGMVFFTFPYTLTAADKLVIGSEIWPPYIDKAHPKLGIATEIVTTAMDRSGYKFDDITFGNWSDILNGGKIGVYDVIVAGWHSEEREKYFEFSEPYLFNEIKFLKVKDKPYKIEKISDLKGLLVGIIPDYAYSEKFDKSDIPIKIANRHIIQNLLLLQQGKIDLTLDDELVIRHQLSRYLPNALDQFEFIDKPLAKKGLHILISLKNKNHREITENFNNVIKEMKDDGTIKKIFSTYKEELEKLRY